MKEIRDIIKAADVAQESGLRTALATVVHVEGSSYRRPGARMLITEDGRLTGAISGGCLEGDALRKTMLALSQNRTILVTYDTMDEDDAKLGAGLGCQGIIRVLIEPIDHTIPDNPITLLKAVASQRRNAVLTTLFCPGNTHPGTCLMISQTEIIGNKIPSNYKDHLLINARQVLENRHSIFKNYIHDSENLSAFFQFLEPAISLIIAGAGNDVLPLVQMADILGWETTVIDGRPSLARNERFLASCRVMVAKPEQILSAIHIDDTTVFLLMTHNYNYDLAILQQLLTKNLKYIGMLGPKTKMERMIHEIQSADGVLPAEQLAKLHSPVGLDIGAETPEEIALSILAEIKAVLTGRQGLSLHANTGAIHSRSELVMQTFLIKD